jgi:hypothetical protein
MILKTNDTTSLKALEKIFKKYSSVLHEAAETIRLQGVSNYPMFVAAQADIEMGIPLLKQGTMPEDWLVNASTLEEFYAKQVIPVEKLDNFKTLYKSHNNRLCIAAFTDGGAKFLFIP